MRILIIHNQLWAHYKSKLFSEIHSCMQERHPESTLLVAQIALYEDGRGGMQDEENFTYDYPYQVLFERGLSEVTFSERLSALFRTFNDFKPTILNVTGYFDWAQVLLMAYAKTKGVKVVLSSESSSADHNRSVIKEKIKSGIISMADAFFCFGKTSSEYLLSLGAEPQQIAVAHAAVIDQTLIRSNYDQAKSLITVNTNDNRTFVFVGRLAQEKNLDMLLNAFLKLKEEEAAKSWNLLFVGEGPRRSELQSYAEQSQFSDSIIFAGGMPWHKVPAWLAKSDVLVLPSKSEPWGLVVNEAMVCSMPVIVSEKCGCAPDLVQNTINGFIFNPEAQKDLENSLRYFMQNPERIAPMGERSAHLVERFSSGKVAAEMVKCYAKL